MALGAPSLPLRAGSWGATGPAAAASGRSWLARLFPGTRPRAQGVRLFLCGLLLAALAACGPAPSATGTPPPPPTPTATALPTPPPPTARPRPTPTAAAHGGNIYRNDVYGYELRYPTGWNLWGNQEPWYPVQVFQGPGFLWLDVQNNLSGRPLPEWLEQEAGSVLRSGVAREVRPISVEGVAGLRFIWHDPGGVSPDQDLALLERDGFVYVLRMDSAAFSDLFDQVVLSFRLIEPTILLPSEARALLSARAAEVIAALREQDLTRLSACVHPTRGVLFSPYAFINPEFDRTLSAARLREMQADPTLYLWGYYDGSGLPIELTFADYFRRFVYSQDFARLEQVGYNQIIGRGNTINNQFDLFPHAIVVEYYFPGADPAFAGMDWESLRLIFEEQDGTWYLVAIVHDGWTI